MMLRETSMTSTPLVFGATCSAARPFALGASTAAATTSPISVTKRAIRKVRVRAATGPSAAASLYASVGGLSRAASLRAVSIRPHVESSPRVLRQPADRGERRRRLGPGELLRARGELRTALPPELGRDELERAPPCLDRSVPHSVVLEHEQCPLEGGERTT